MDGPARLLNTQDLQIAESRFDEMKVSWDSEHESQIVRILPGEYYVTREDQAISTVLGSCIAACIRCPHLGIGGMNHFMLPIWSEGRSTVWSKVDKLAAMRFGNYAMEALINSILSRGGRRDVLEVKLFGGGRMYEGTANVGGKNAEFALEYVATEGMKLLTHDLGGDTPRRVVYFPKTGRARLKRLPAVNSREVEAREREYLHSLEVEPVAGDIELF